MKIEICANSFESALAAQNAGAARIELCAELALGGITPSYGLIEKVTQELEIPVFLLVRPRSGDFTYTAAEFDVMLRDIRYAKSVGVAGIVSGVLLSDYRIDSKRTTQLIAAAAGMSFTFHRAFDWTPDAAVALKQLIDLKVNRVLTSGQQPTAMLGFETLKELLHLSKDRIGILPGGGISETNISQFKSAGFKEVHGSFSSFRESAPHHIPMHNSKALDAHHITYTDVQKIKNALSK